VLLNPLAARFRAALLSFLLHFFLFFFRFTRFLLAVENIALRVAKSEAQDRIDIDEYRGSETRCKSPVRVSPCAPLPVLQLFWNVRSDGRELNAICVSHKVAIRTKR